MRLAISLIFLAFLSLSCSSGSSDSGSGPLNSDECAQLEDHFHNIYGDGLTGEDLEEYNRERDREAEIQDCVAEQNWSRKGFECAMKTDTESGLDRCVFVND